MSYGESSISPEMLSQWLANEQETNKNLRAENEKLKEALENQVIAGLKEDRKRLSDQVSALHACIKDKNVIIRDCSKALSRYIDDQSEGGLVRRARESIGDVP
jgi:hypothetical protein